MNTSNLILVYLSVFIGVFFTLFLILLIGGIVNNTERNLIFGLFLAASGWASFATLLNM